MADSLHSLGGMRSLPSSYVEGGWGFGATRDNRTVYGGAGIAQTCVLRLRRMVAERVGAESTSRISADVEIALVVSGRAAGISACHGFTDQEHGGQNRGRI